MLDKKLCYQVKSYTNLVDPLEATFSVQMFALVKSYTSSKMGQVGSLCVCSRGHILSPILMKLGQTICLVEISDELEGKCVMSVKKLGH